MICPNCQQEVTKGFLCPYCGVDIYIFTKAQHVSIRLYNQALSEAQQRNLTMAKELLTQSLVFDKNNIDARNLLGLIECELGHIAEAMKQWILSVSISPKENIANRYMEYWQKHARELERWNDGVQMYNKSLRLLKQGNEDLAIIQLKKCLDVHSNFIDACNLMALCCIKDQNEPRALQFIERVLQKDCSNATALHYVQALGGMERIYELYGKKKKKWKKEKQASQDKRTDAKESLPRYQRMEARQAPFSRQNNWIAFLAGVIASCAVLILLVWPTINEEQIQQLEHLQTQISLYAGTTNLSPEEVAEQSERVMALEQENKQLRSEDAKQANLELLETAILYLGEQQYELCATTLETIDTVGFSQEQLQKYESTKQESYPKAAESFLSKGKSAFFGKQFSQAKEYLNFVITYSTETEWVSDAYYYLAQVAQEEQDIDTAKEYYQILITKYPEYSHIADVQNALENLENVSNAAESHTTDSM